MDQDFKKLYEDEKKKVSVLEQRLRLYEEDPERRGYFSLLRTLNQHVDILNKFDLDKEITSNSKEDKIYDRTKSLWEGLAPLIILVKSLKTELRITAEEEEKEKTGRFKATTPESIASNIGNTAGQNM
jgi:hypothetical protein